jgi:hypothetical protein
MSPTQLLKNQYPELFDEQGHAIPAEPSNHVLAQLEALGKQVRSEITVKDPSTTTIRNDGGKNRVDLLPVRPLERVAEVLTVGAEKYNQTFDMTPNFMLPFLKEELVKCQIVRNVKISLIVSDFVDLATRKNYVEKTLSMLKDKEKIDSVGVLKILNELNSSVSYVKEIQSNNNEIDLQKGRTNSLSSDLLQIPHYYFLEPKISDVLSAEQNFKIRLHTLIMTITQAKQEDTYVLVATKDWALWEILWKDLCEQSLISTNLQHRVSFKENKLSLVGQRNWEPGMAWSRCYASALRHLFAWWRGEDKDPQTGLSHLAHCACNILFLLEYQELKRGTDDRPR